MRALVAALALCACDKVYGLDDRGDHAKDASGDSSEADGLVAWFTMDSIGSMLEDSSTTGLVGLCTNARCPTMASSGVVGGALHFDGMTTVGANSKPALETRGGFTVAGWVRPEGPAVGFTCPFNKVSSAGANSWQLCLSPGATGLLVHFYTDDNGNDDMLTGGEIDFDGFHHVVLWWDGESKRIYVDGLMRASKAGPTVFTGGVLSIGADIDSGTILAKYTGDVDDLRVYDRALDDAEIGALFALGTP